jgi:hypothetical protein
MSCRSIWDSGDKVDMQAIELDNKLLAFWRSIIVVMTIALIFLLQSCTTHNHNKYGAATPDRVVEQYLTALETRNETSLMRLTPEKSPVAAEVKAKIERFGGYKIQDRQVKYTKPKPSLWNANIRGFYIDRRGNRQKFEDSIVIEYQSKGELKLYAGRWYLLLESRG